MKVVLKVWDSLELWVVGVASVGCVALIVYSVTLRYFFSRPPGGWLEEIVIITLGWCVYIAISTELRDRHHVALRITVAGLPLKTKAVVEFGMTLVSIGILIVTLLLGWNHVFLLKSQGLHLPSTMATPLWLIYLAVPVGMVLLILRSIQRLYRIMRNPVESLREVEEIEITHATR